MISILEQIVPIIAVSGVFGGPVAIVGITAWYRLKRQRQHNEIIRAALEAGKDIAPELLLPPSQPKRSLNVRVPHLLLILGIVLVGFGVALFLVIFLKQLPNGALNALAKGMVGMMFALPGAGLLIADRLIKKQSSRQPKQ